MEDSAGFLSYHCHPHANRSLHHLMTFSQSNVFFMHNGSKNCLGGFSILHIGIRASLNVHAEG